MEFTVRGDLKGDIEDKLGCKSIMKLLEGAMVEVLGAGPYPAIILTALDVAWKF